MAEKRRYTVSVPDHVANAVEARARPLGATPTEYAADVLRWWFGQGCPPVTHDESALLAAQVSDRLKPMPHNLSVWSLGSQEVYAITGDKVVMNLLTQLKIPNLFAQAAEHDAVSMIVAFDNHPTHWLQFDFFKGSTTPAGDGLAFYAYPKASVTRTEMMQKWRAKAKEIGASGPLNFSQIPMLEKREMSNQTATKVAAAT